ncbi:MAG: hypothetical protein KDK41_08205 [Leptospiraceae bacterium]|nr:hypothetical protein [Leptospiraceae bacterium]
MNDYTNKKKTRYKQIVARTNNGMSGFVYSRLKYLFSLLCYTSLITSVIAVPAEKIREQFLSAPEDPSFSFDTRNIPGFEGSSTYLNKELEKEVIVETLEGTKNQANKENSINANLPNLTQALVIGFIVIIFILYRIRIRNNSKFRKR